MYPENIFNETISKKNCKQITIDQFKPILIEVKNVKLSNVELYILEHRFIRERTVSKIMYDLGYKTTSQVYSKIRKIISVLTEIINFRFCDKNDTLSMFIGDGIIKKACINDCTIAEALDMYKPGYIYHNYYDEVIAYSLLKRFDYQVDLLSMHALMQKEHKIMLYSILYSDGTPEVRSDGTSFHYLFIKNIDMALRVIFSYDNSYMSNIYSLLILYSMDREAMNKTVFVKLHSNYFKKIICDPGCLYTSEYFDHKDVKNIDISYISVAISTHLYDVCKKLVTTPNGDEKSLFKLLYCICCVEQNKDISEKDKKDLKDLVADICSVNNYIKETYTQMESFISESKEFLDIK